MYGGFGSYLFTAIAGLARAPGARGYAQLLFRPAAFVHAALTSASASVDSPAGPVAIAWAQVNATTLLRASVTVPVGASATAVLPVGRGRAAADVAVTEGGAVVYAKGAFVPGAAAGVVGAAAGPAGSAPAGQQAVVLSLLGGSFEFEVAMSA